MIFVYVSIPLPAAAIGYVTKLVAIRMMFQPLEYIGRMPFGWQGVVPRHAARTAGVAVDLMTSQLISPAVAVAAGSGAAPGVAAHRGGVARAGRVGAAGSAGRRRVGVALIQREMQREVARRTGLARPLVGFAVGEVQSLVLEHFAR